MELAAAGVSIALFNQASRIFIFPLVSITTSFVAEEDTIERLNTKAAENGNDKAKLNEVIMPEEDHMLQDIEKGNPKENIDQAPKEPGEEKDESKDLVVKSFATVDVENNATVNNDTKNVHGTFLSL